MPLYNERRTGCRGCRITSFGLLLELEGHLQHHLVLLDRPVFPHMAADVPHLEPGELVQALVRLADRSLDGRFDAVLGDPDYFHLFVDPVLTVHSCPPWETPLSRNLGVRLRGSLCGIPPVCLRVTARLP